MRLFESLDDTGIGAIQLVKFKDKLGYLQEKSAGMASHLAKAEGQLEVLRRRCEW